MTSEFAKPIRFEVSCQQAKQFLTNEEGWSEEKFEEVDCNTLDSAAPECKLDTIPSKSMMM